MVKSRRKRIPLWAWASLAFLFLFFYPIVLDAYRVRVIRHKAANLQIGTSMAEVKQRLGECDMAFNNGTEWAWPAQNVLRKERFGYPGFVLAPLPQRGLIQ